MLLIIRNIKCKILYILKMNIIFKLNISNDLNDVQIERYFSFKYELIVFYEVKVSFFFQVSGQCETFSVNM